MQSPSSHEPQDVHAPSRREFLDRLALGVTAVGGLSLGLGSLPTTAHAATRTGATLSREFAPIGDQASDAWDLRWPSRLTGTVRTVFDVPEIESGYGAWRASIWSRQYEAVLQTRPRDMSTALVLRHNAIVLAMQQEFWDRYAIGRRKQVTHPATLEPTDRNPALLSSTRGEVPADYDAFALDQVLARGGIALACDLALRDCVALIEQEERVSADEARKRAIALMVPGVILQPSGVFAVLRAQQAGALYIRAS